MAVTGGPVESVSIKGRIFAVAADADGNRDLGGFTVEKSPNGDGSARSLKTRKPWKYEGLTLVCDDINGGQEYLQALQDSGEDVPVNITHASGVVYAGQGLPVGDLVASTKDATVAVTLSGPGKLEQQ